jgi:acyl carrier protein phosphodiesterase
LSKHHERIGSALELLTTGLQGFVESRLRSVYNDAWVQAAASSFRDDRSRLAPGGDGVRWDAHALLTVMWDQWNAAFRSHLGHAERSLVSELREFRNRWAHQADFDFDDAYRVLDSVRRLLQAVQSPNLGAIQEQKRDLIESYVAEEVHTQMQRTAFNRNRWWVILIYALCCGAIIFHILNADMSASLFFVSTVLLVFIYLIYQQFKLEAPVLYGPHECPRCRKIIYRRSCPYCDA